MVDKAARLWQGGETMTSRRRDSKARRRNTESWCDECCCFRSGDLSACARCGIERCDTCLGESGLCVACRLLIRRME